MTIVAEQASALIELLHSSADLPDAHLARAASLVRQLVDSGEWNMALELARAGQRGGSSDRSRSEFRLMEAECLSSMGEFGAAIETLLSLKSSLEGGGEIPEVQ